MEKSLVRNSSEVCVDVLIADAADNVVVAADAAVAADAVLRRGLIDFDNVATVAVAKLESRSRNSNRSVRSVW